MTRRQTSSWLDSSAFLPLFAQTGLATLLVYLPLAQVLQYPFRERDFFGGVTGRWGLSSLGSYDVSALWGASVATVVSCVTILLLAVLGGAVLAGILALFAGATSSGLITGLLLGLVASEGLLKALVYRSVFGMRPSLASFVVLATLMILPLSILCNSLGLRRLDLETLSASRDLGATPWMTLRHIVLPINWPATRATAWICGVLLFFNLVYAEVFLGGHRFLLASLVRYQFLETGDWPSAIISVVAGILCLIVCVSAVERLLSLVLRGKP